MYAVVVIQVTVVGVVTIVNDGVGGSSAGWRAIRLVSAWPSSGEC